MPGIITPMSHQKEPNTRQYNTEMHWWHGGEGEKKFRLKGSGGINGHAHGKGSVQAKSRTMMKEALLCWEP
ncbi:hypothetical protein GGP41_009560 [Bipolaris sorokiniana]|uniref:Uncharacterized protein n=1 Tax=Cochliobolus sativus TaxID=45130 RepID=A0A8H5ZAQ9_COCSA|nr:hypothetical protein GGP41_009560 [Bipolaris sorokiniana]